MSSRHNIQDATGVIERLPPLGHLQTWGRGAPTNSQAGFLPSCTYHNITGTVGSLLYVNIGTVTSTNWLNIA